MKEICYFPGCSLHGPAREYGDSIRLVCKLLGISLMELQDWSCCGTTAAHSLNRELGISLARRNLDLARWMGFDRVMTPCAGCFSRLATASREITGKRDGFRSAENELSRSPYPMPDVIHLLRFLMEDVGEEALTISVHRSLKSLRLAAYYGCLLTRPRAVARFDDPEQPVSMDRLLGFLGAETVQWSHKTECCGGSYAASDSSIVIELSSQVLEAAQQAGAQAIVVACPMCQMNLDSRQEAIAHYRKTRFNMPIIYLTQLMGLAYGLPFRLLGWKKLFVSPLPLLKTGELV